MKPFNVGASLKVAGTFKGTLGNEDGQFSVGGFCSS